MYVLSQIWPHHFSVTFTLSVQNYQEDFLHKEILNLKSKKIFVKIMSYKRKV